jgi:hypothetical protein
MRRITVVEVGPQWSFEPGAEAGVAFATILEAAVAAAHYGESLIGNALGYIIRISLATIVFADRDSLVLHTRVFSEATAAQVPKLPT